MSSSKSTSRSTTQNFDRRVAADGSVVATEGATINIQDVSAEGFKAISDLGTKVLGFANTAQVESARLSDAALTRAFDSTAGGTADLVRQMITWGAVAAVAVVAFRTAPKLLRGTA